MSHFSCSVPAPSEAKLLQCDPQPQADELSPYPQVDRHSCQLGCSKSGEVRTQVHSGPEPNTAMCKVWTSRPAQLTLSCTGPGGATESWQASI